MSRIVLLIDCLGPGGAQRQLVGLASMLNESGFLVQLAVYREDRFASYYLQNTEFQYVQITNTRNVFKRIMSILRFFRREKPDWVISYLESPSIYASLGKWLGQGYKLIVSERNTTQHIGFRERLRFFLFRKSDFVVPNSFSQESFLREFFPELSSKIKTIPNFVDLGFFAPSHNRKRHDPPEIIVVATIWPSKNTLGFVDVVASLKLLGIKFHVSWYGKDAKNIDYFYQCQHRIESLGVEDYIELKDKTQAIREKYQSADYFCLPSFYEGTPNAICEAMACGLPIACSDVCDNSLYVLNNVNGFLFNPNSPDSISSSLVKMLLLNDDEYCNFCSSSRHRAELLLSKESFVHSYLNILGR